MNKLDGSNICRILKIGKMTSPKLKLVIGRGQVVYWFKKTRTKAQTAEFQRIWFLHFILLHFQDLNIQIDACIHNN